MIKNKYFLSYKWNGSRLVVYKYQDQEGKVYVSARTRWCLVLRDFEAFKPLSLFLDWSSKLEPSISLPLTMSNLPPVLYPLNFDVQSITCELFGTNVPHVVSYPFNLQLKPLYYTHNEGGAITPISDIEEEETIEQTLATAVEAGLGLYCGPISIPSSPSHSLSPSPQSDPSLSSSLATSSPLSDVELICKLLSKKAHELNISHRKANGLPEKSNHFAIEGWVLHLLDENGLSIDSNMYSLQPDEFKQTHWESFGFRAQKKALIAYQEVLKRGKPVTPSEMRKELALSFSQWGQFSRDVMGLVDGIPAAVDASQRPKNAKPRMIILCGLPGSGKSTFSKKLIGKGWERCNQDELGNRKQVENVVIGHLKAGKNVLVDRCNFDYSQRHTWVKIASSFGVKWITCIVLQTDPEVCKQRVSVREGHETIPTGDQGVAIIDKFKDLWVEPHSAEGYCEIIQLKTELEIENTLQKLIIQHLESKVDYMESTITHLNRKVHELEANAKKAKQQQQQQQQVFSSNPFASVADMQ